jgi:hypothetical protein
MEFILLSLGIMAISFFLAWKSMEDFQESPAKDLSYQLYLLRDLTPFNAQFFQKLHNYLLKEKTFLSVEKLYKGKESVIVVYAPESFIKSFPEFNLLLLEDYLALTKAEQQNDRNKISIDKAFTFDIKPTSQISIKEENLGNVVLKENQRSFFQIVCAPIKGAGNLFQVTVRFMVSDQTPQKRLELAKLMMLQVKKILGLESNNKRKPSKALFRAYGKRMLVPKEVKSFVLSGEMILKLIYF